ncbi:crossover junction endodeoxyribonuclease RuvC [Candidatus Wolfebacteria bacterium]|nr:crossover junction endodeoxyribonuclease RuvC [Candidatus Wolfebacteria bacterium]
MRVIGIDPGYDRLGVAVVERRGEKNHVLFSTCLEASRSLSFSERIRTGAAGVADIVTKYRPTAAAIEKTFFSKNQKTAIAVSEARGAILYVLANAEVPITEYTPQEVKIAVTGYGKSGKDHVADMVSRLTVLDDATRRDDEFDAVAIALTHLASTKDFS